VLYSTLAVVSSVADPDPKDPNIFAGSGSVFLRPDSNPDPDPYTNEIVLSTAGLKYRLLHISVKAFCQVYFSFFLSVSVNYTKNKHFYNLTFFTRIISWVWKKGNWEKLEKI